jgi:tRNA-specific 2-thiouridylase
LHGLAVLKKPESMGLCFVGKRDMENFLGGYLSLTPGSFIDYDTGLVVGKHNGKELFTVGQGARIAGAEDRYFIIFCAPNTTSTSSNSTINRSESEREPGDVFVVKGATHPKLFSTSLTLDTRSISWVAGEPPPGLLQSHRLALSFKARYNQSVDPCQVRMLSGGEFIEVLFHSPQRAITPGQVCALYDGDVVLGGGIIS